MFEQVFVFKQVFKQVRVFKQMLLFKQVSKQVRVFKQVFEQVHVFKQVFGAQCWSKCLSRTVRNTNSASIPRDVAQLSN